jgi:GMP synthase (glutamine-hydrolysing)
MQNIPNQILIVDFGSQYTQLVARRIRELGVYSEIVSHKHASSRIDSLLKDGLLKGLVLSGGPHSVYEKDAPTFDKSHLDGRVPVLGICYGVQLLNLLLGGKVTPAAKREYGFEIIEWEVGDSSSLNLIADSCASASAKVNRLAGFSNSPYYPKENGNQVWMSHGDEISTLAPSLQVLAHSNTGTIAAVQHSTLPLFGLQFHPEVEHSRCGKALIAEFLFGVCRLTSSWTPKSQIEVETKKILAQVNKNSNSDSVICALSGGVDSTVAAVLTSKAVGNRLTCFFIDSGLLRKGEAEQVKNRYAQDFQLNVRCIDASDLFLTRLAGVTDPEQKRKIIGKSFIDVFEREAKTIPNTKFLVQGTLYTDVIESVSVHGTSVTIKSHHNVGGLPERMDLELVEPLRELFKDEVRRLGAELGIAGDVLNRHPFPGPGLAIRVLGEVTRERLQVLREADAILIDELHKQNQYSEVWQAFVVLLPVQSVGVMGDGRTYENVAAVRCVSATDGMTADWSRLPHEFLAKVSGRIINEVRGINRVVYDISSKPPATIEWE